MRVAAGLVVQQQHTEDRRRAEGNNATHRYIQFDVSRFGLPVNHSGAKVIQPGGAVNHVSASQSRNALALNNNFATPADPHIRLTKSAYNANNARAPPTLFRGN